MIAAMGKWEQVLSFWQELLSSINALVDAGALEFVMGSMTWWVPTTTTNLRASCLFVARI